MFFFNALRGRVVVVGFVVLFVWFEAVCCDRTAGIKTRGVCAVQPEILRDVER